MSGLLFKILKFIALYLVFSLLLFIVFFLSLGYYLEIEDDPRKVDAIVVISGGGLERIEKGVELLRAGWSEKLILSGAAYDDGFSNAASMQIYATQQGVKREKIFVDEEAQNTYQNAYYVNQILEENDFLSIILVTSAYHQRRAYNTFKNVISRDIEIINVPAEVEFWDEDSWWKTEKGKLLTLQEVGKIVYSFVSGNYE